MGTQETNPTRINYQAFCDELVATLPASPKKRLLLHACCGPCSCYPLTYLCRYFDVTIYYANSNIYPSEEYQKRLGELRKLIEYLKRDQGYDIHLVVPPYENPSFTERLSPLKDEPEGGKRCFLCYSLRMEEAYAYAEKEGYDYFTTTMTVSRQKDSQKFNEIGKALSAKYGKTAYLYSDFKKHGGQEIGVGIRKNYGLYNQNYCGCVYSYEAMLERTAQNQKSEE